MSFDRLEMKAGGEFLFVGAIKITDSEGVEKNDFTGWLGRCGIFRKEGDFYEAVEFTWTDEALGVYKIHASSAATIGWKPGKYSSDFKLTSPEGEVVASPTFFIIVGECITR